jgi:hypothetical protein
LQVTRAKICPVSRSTETTCATASPAGYVPSIPEVISRSPAWISTLGERKRSSGRRPLPAPYITLRTPLLSTFTGTA